MTQQSPSRTTKSRERVSKLCDTLAVLYFVARRDYSVDLTHRAIRVLQLAAFSEEPPRIDDVAKFLGCALSTASELVKRLQKKGLLVRRRSAKDERVVHLALTENGRSALTEHTSLDPQKLGLGLDVLGARDQKELIRLMEQLAQQLSEQSICTRADAPRNSSK